MYRDDRIAELFQQIHSALVNLELVSQIPGAHKLVELMLELGYELRDEYGIYGLVDDDEEEYEEEEEEDSDDSEDDTETLLTDQDMWS